MCEPFLPQSSGKILSTPPPNTDLNHGGRAIGPLTCEQYLFIRSRPGYNEPASVRATVVLREYWMIYRRQGFLAVIWSGSFPASSPLPSGSSLSQSYCLPQVEITDVEGGGGGWRSQIMRRRESLVLFKSFNTLQLYSSSLFCVHNCTRSQVLRPHSNTVATLL